MSIPRAVVVAWVVCIGLCLSVATALAHSGHEGDDHSLALVSPSEVMVQPAAVGAACAGGDVLDTDYELDECYVHEFQVGGVDKSVTVWYSKIVSNVTRYVDGNPTTLQHWITSDNQAVQVGEWFEDAWLRYYADSGGHNLYDFGCGDNINVRMEDGVGWSGIAYWAGNGNCKIGIDSPMVRGGGGQWTVYHEAQHYLQYSYNAGCYLNSLKPGYSGNSEFVEGYADLGADSVDNALDATGYSGNGYANLTSMYDKSYGNRFNKYFIEQLGTIGTPADAWHHMDALYDHYAACDVADDLYVLDTLVPSLSGGLWSVENLFTNFFAANWAKDWADPATQSDIIYYDDDTGAYGAPTLTQNVNMAGGSNNWPDSTPDDWAAKYYQITPQAGCPYIEMSVDGAPGAQLGINFMAAKTTVPRKVLRSAWIGEDYVRTFAAQGVHDKLVTVVNSFENNYNYTVNATCVTPVLNILEPRQVNPAFVGAPDAPIAFLARWNVKSGVSGVRGLPDTQFSFDVEGEAATIVPGSFQAVGDEYWAVLIPPDKAGDASLPFLNLQICLDGAVCDTETDALLYVDPGNTDIAMVFDGSGSMAAEDTIGEGARVDNAKRAGNVIADLLRPGDRILVTDFSAFDNPVGCGNANQDCQLDIIERLGRQDVGDPATPIINATKLAISQVTPREWTPIGPALEDAKDRLLNLPGNTNPKHIFLLSDGEENVKPLYADLQTELVDSGVVINTIGFGPESPGNLLAQIAADTGGVYRPVPTTPSGASAAEVDAAPYLPGQLRLAEVYDYFDTIAEDAVRVVQQDFVNQTYRTCREDGDWGYVDVQVSTNTSLLRFVVAGKQADGVQGLQRRVQVLQPGVDPIKGWIEISPPQTAPPIPAEWDIRNDPFEDVLFVPKPTVGLWRFRTCYLFVDDILTRADYMMSVSLQTDIRLHGRIVGLPGNQGVAGDHVTILGYLLDRKGLLPATSMMARIQHPGGTQTFPMHDDGLHNDGAAGDHIYGVVFYQTVLGGGYDVRIRATLPDPNAPAVTLQREWYGGFWIKGPRPEPTGEQDPEDRDGDGMPDDWERRCKLNPEVNDAADDPDQDGLSNIRELFFGTSPCDPDTDNGGEKDGSEVQGKRDPLNPRDDRVPGIRTWHVRPMNKFILIDWTKPLSYTNMILWVSTDPNQLGDRHDMGTGGDTGDFQLDGLMNDTKYWIRLQGQTVEGEGPPSQPEEVMPKADPDAPSGAMLIENGAPATDSKQVTLNLSSTDKPLEGAAQGANAHQTDIYSLLFNEAVGNVKVRISNYADMTDGHGNPVPYQALTPQIAWTLPDDCEIGDTCVVYAQFKDGAGNESLIVYDDIVLGEPGSMDRKMYLPTIQKS